MLILTRKQNESVFIDGNIKATVLSDRHGQVKLGIEARGKAIGLWAAPAIPPWEWRRKGSQLTTSTDCNIKGNISSSGKRIYHVPGGRWYGKTKINEAKGERWFCSEDEARAAGWRAPYN